MARLTRNVLVLAVWAVLSALGVEAAEAQAAAGATPRPGPTVRRVTPEGGLQAAIAVAKPGDVITLAPGVYYESIRLSRSGTADAPIVIRAEEGGAATISGAAPPSFKLRFKNVAGDLYVAAVPWPVRWVMADGRNLNAYDNPANLRDFLMGGRHGRGRLPGPPEGFAWRQGRLYVRLLAGQNPGKAQLEINRRPPKVPSIELHTSAGAWRPGNGVNVAVNADYVVLEGLRLRMAPDVGVRVRGISVTVRDCYIAGAHRGIDAGRSPNLTVERCEFTGYPAYQWVRWGHWAATERSTRDHLWSVVYNTNLCITFINHSGPSARVRQNLIYECFDGMRPRNMGTLDPAKTSEYAYNVVMSCGDDAIEFDTMTPINLRVHHNFVMDAFVLFGLSPVQGGGLTIDHNIGYVSPERGLKGCTVFKFDCPGGFRWTGRPTQGCTIVHNTLVNPRNVIYWNGNDYSFRDNVLENNILCVGRSVPWKLPGFETSRHNIYAGPAIDPAHLPHMVHAAGPGFVVPPSWDAEPGPVVPLLEAGFAQDRPEPIPMVDFRLRPDSPAVDAGAAGNDEAYHHTSKGPAPDMGAIELGDEWQFPRPGPRWAVGDKAPWRPPLPPSLDPKWIGLDTAPVGDASRGEPDS